MTLTPATRPAPFDARVMAHIPMLQKLARKLPAQKREDAIQQTIATALDKWDEFAETGSFHKWLRYKFMHAIDDRTRRRFEVEDVDGKLAAKLSQPPSQEAMLEISATIDLVKGSDVLSCIAAGGSVVEFSRLAGVTIQAATQKAKRHRVKYLADYRVAA